VILCISVTLVLLKTWGGAFVGAGLVLYAIDTHIEAI
jgi:hypothetical protein